MSMTMTDTRTAPQPDPMPARPPVRRERDTPAAGREGGTEKLNTEWKITEHDVETFYLHIGVQSHLREEQAYLWSGPIHLGTGGTCNITYMTLDSIGGDRDNSASIGMRHMDQADWKADDTEREIERIAGLCAKTTREMEEEFARKERKLQEDHLSREAAVETLRKLVRTESAP